MNRQLARIPVVCIAALAMALPASGVVAQSGPTAIGLGVVANPPRQFLGLQGHVILPLLGGIGVYVDGKWDSDSPDDRPEYDPSLTASEVEAQTDDRFFRDEDSWQNINVALVKAVTPEFSLYAGAGRARRTVFASYEASDGSGVYTVSDPERDADQINVLGGGFMAISRSLRLQFGIETEPRGFTVGLGYLFQL